ncbi:hypothetical protein QQZ08_010752 [Neonectria magnoliae]|uniref:Cerato-platanin n=1 Tax=Neonectria magnoliae TaxID=2732573 RepID=A0ABR1HF15_9HYPO
MRPLLPLLLVSSAAAAKSKSKTYSVGVTPHASYSSSIGVLGCKVDTDRVAYWPMAVDCTNICVSLSYQDRSVKLLRVDQSEGAYDVSYDAWNYLYTGHSATDQPTAGGAVDMTYRAVDASECDGLINTKGHKLPLSASNSMNFLASCLDQNDTWVADNYVLYNIADPICTMGFDEKCDLDYPAQNQASCPHTLGLAPTLDDAPVYNIEYPTGEKVRAGIDDDSGALVLPRPSIFALMLMLVSCLLCG